jgi:hypothetical protein
MTASIDERYKLRSGALWLLFDHREAVVWQLVDSPLCGVQKGAANAPCNKLLGAEASTVIQGI